MKKTFTNTLKYFFNALFLVTLCLCNTTNVFACNTTSDDSLPDHEVVDVEYISYNTFIESQISSNTISIEPQSRIKYIIKNLSDTGESLGTTKYQSDEGVPGVTVGINRSINLSASCSISTADIQKALGSKLGFNVTASYSVGASSSWTVPNTVNGRKVRYGYIVAKPVHDNWKYDVYIDSSRIQESFLTHGTVSKPRDRMRIEKVVVYK